MKTRRQFMQIAAIFVAGVAIQIGVAKAAIGALSDKVKWRDLSPTKWIPNPDFYKAKYELGQWIEDCYPVPFHFIPMRSDSDEFLNSPCLAGAIMPAIEVPCEENDPEAISMLEMISASTYFEAWKARRKKVGDIFKNADKSPLPVVAAMTGISTWDKEQAGFAEKRQALAAQWEAERKSKQNLCQNKP